ncbi:nitroreductase family protein, partial [Bacteroidales bacterium OttesenSCG-928-I21]|nr:nitroreductase family protein [Bacteroidales bacterium OttesenSCG-928-I21]
METILELIRQRRSPRDFSDREIKEEDLQKIFEAARWAPSSYNRQPWRFIYADRGKNPELYDVLLNVMVEFNQAWAKAAPVLILAMTTVKYEHYKDDHQYSWYDLALAVENMAIMSEGLGISIHQMSGFDSQKTKEDLNIPENFEPVTMIAMGYAEKTGNLPLDIYKMEAAPRERKEIEEIFFN